MFENAALGAAVLKNPAMVQSLVLTEFEQRLGGVYSVADPNNAFNLQLEAASSINAQSVRYMTQQFQAQYAVRATTAAELYNHMSDFDYLTMVAAPAATTVQLTFDNDYLVANALAYDTLYDQVVIPAGTQFYIGPLTFGIYYPINININKITGNINVLWDTSTPNPLQALSSNMVPFVQYSAGGLNLLGLSIPISQFAVATTTYPVVAQQGFIQTLAYTDQFYAVRVFTNTATGGGWSELAYTLSETVYDPTVPTAKITIQNDVNQLIISVPQVYFTNNQIGNQIMVSVYTTKGAMTLDLTSVELTTSNCNFNLSATGTSPNAAILNNLATVDLTPKDTSIIGGSNALTFSQLRNLVVNGGLYTTVPITPAELTTYAAKQGFSISKYIDNITDRIYYASNTLQGGQNGVVMVAMGTIGVTPATIAATSTILAFPSEQAVTILPTTLYEFNNQTNTATPLSDSQVTALGQLTKPALAAALNANTYTKSPFHVVTYTGAQYPETKSFNLMNPVVANIRFVADNVYLTPQMSITSAVVIHNANGTGGYTLRLGVVKTPAMQQIAESDITVYLSVTDSNNEAVYGIATLVGTTSALSIYELAVPTSYYLSAADTFRSTLTAVSGGAVTTDLALSSTFTATFLLNASLYPQVVQESNLIAGIPAPYNALLAVSQQQLDVVFGTDLSSQIYNITNATWSNLTYATHPTTVYKTYPNDVYATNAEGGLIYSVTDGVVVLTKLHSAGDPMLDSNNAPLVLYPAGSPLLDPYGNPVVLATRQLNYYVNGMMFDLRLFYSQNQTDITTVQNLTTTLSTIFATLAAIQQNLLEQTQLYYLPNSTMGTASFSAGNNTPLSLNLGFSFALAVYVAQATLDNPTLLATISADIQTIIQQEMTNAVISLTDIAQTIKTTLGTVVISVDVDGIDNTQTLQTVIVPSGTVSPIVAQQLVYDPDNDTLALQQAITITFNLAA